MPVLSSYIWKQHWHLIHSGLKKIVNEEIFEETYFTEFLDMVSLNATFGLPLNTGQLYSLLIRWKNKTVYIKRILTTEILSLLLNMACFDIEFKSDLLWQ